MDSTILIIQSILFIVLIAIFIVVGKVYGVKLSTKELAVGAILVVLSVVLSFFSIMLPILGVPGLKIGFAQLPLLLSGFVVSPFVALLVGLVSDLIGLLVVPTSFPFLGFTLNSLLICLLPALVVYHHRFFTKERVKTLLMTLTMMVLGGSALYLFFTSEVKIGSEIMVLSNPVKVGVLLFLVGVSALVAAAIFFLQKRFTDDSFITFVFMVVVMEVFINMICTPLWLAIMYGTPYLVSLFLRIVKGGVMIPFTIFFGYSLYLILLRIKTSTRVK